MNKATNSKNEGENRTGHTQKPQWGVTREGNEIVTLRQVQSSFAIKRNTAAGLYMQLKSNAAKR